MGFPPKNENRVIHSERPLHRQSANVFTRKPKRCLQLDPLKDYPIDQSIMEVIQSGGKNSARLSVQAKEWKKYIDDCSRIDEKKRVTQNSHKKQMKLMVDLEDGAERILLQELTRHDVQIVKDSEEYYFQTKNEDFFESFGRAFDDGKILDLLINPKVEEWQHHLSQQQWTTRGRIERVCEGKLFFSTNSPLALRQNSRFTVVFMQNRITYQMKHFALDIVCRAKIGDFLFPSEASLELETPSISFQCIGGPLNPEQKLAVSSALAKSDVPFLIFGPPGTGKTKTMVEAICQIVTRSKQKILVCANSNAVCDEIISRIINSKPDVSILRIYSTKREMHKIPGELLEFANYDENTGELFLPELAELQMKQIIVCTLFMSGRLAQGRMPSNHFAYIFIDECASVPEPDALTAIAVAVKSKAVHAKVVLVGDPLQLRGVVQSRLANKMGYDISLMERLMHRSVYKKDTATKQFDNQYVVQLRLNYRSHKAILQPSNDLFYDNTLQAMAKSDITNRYIGTVLLPSQKFPIIFVSLQSDCNRDGSSLNNNSELNVVLSYVEQLLDGQIKIAQSPRSGKLQVISRQQLETTIPKASLSDIGIISPYRGQCRHLESACKRRSWDEIKIGSLEIFQGQERPIIIVSTVRSQMDSVGFLDNFRRLNVLLTRAKCLMIIIGDPFTLCKDDNWRYVLNYILENRGFIQSSRIYPSQATTGRIGLAMNRMRL